MRARLGTQEEVIVKEEAVLCKISLTPRVQEMEWYITMMIS